LINRDAQLEKCKEIAMRRVPHLILRGLIGVIALVGVLGALFAYFAYSTSPEVPRLSGILTQGTMTLGELKRTYRTYVPRGLAKGAPLVIVMHGAGENGALIRIETDYGFERLAEGHGFAVVYPPEVGSDQVRGYRLRRDHPDIESDSVGNLKVRQKHLSPSGRARAPRLARPAPAAT
jgi:poly(3-hydroxybutyrate) depolymerase